MPGDGSPELAASAQCDRLRPTGNGLALTLGIRGGPDHRARPCDVCFETSSQGRITGPDRSGPVAKQYYFNDTLVWALL